MLLEGTNLTGTVCSNRKYLPAGVKKKLAKGETVAFRKNRLLCMGWQDKKHVILISTEGSSKMITYTSKQNHEHQVPEIVRDYNLFMGGVDLSDMCIYMFLDERRTIRWNKKVFFTLLGRLILNSFILYQQNTNHEKKLNQRNFMIQLVEGLIGDYRQTRIRPGRKATDIPKRLLNPEAHMKQTKLPKGKKKNCVICTNLKQNRRIRTSYVSDECGAALCIGQYWEKYHTKKAL